MNDAPILYSFRRCPYAMRARMALQASAVPHDIREIVLRDKPAAMLEASPKGTVPVLVLPDGSVLEQSLDIMRWALEQADPEGWLARGDTDLIAQFDGEEPGGFKHHLDRYKYATRYDTDAAEHREAGLRILGELDARLQAHPYLGGTDRSLTDIAIFPFVRQFANHDREWFADAAGQSVRQWLERCVKSDLFQIAMVKRPPWQPDR